MMQQSPPAWMQEQTKPQVMSPLGRSTSFQYEEGIGPPFKLASLETDSRECKNSTSSLIGHQQQQEYKPPWVQEQPWDEQAARREQILQQQQQQQQQQEQQQQPRALTVSLVLHYHQSWQLLIPPPAATDSLGIPFPLPVACLPRLRFCLLDTHDPSSLGHFTLRGCADGATVLPPAAAARSAAIAWSVYPRVTAVQRWL